MVGNHGSVFWFLEQPIGCRLEPRKSFQAALQPLASEAAEPIGEFWKA
jgi:hypothetical protein